MSAGRGFWSKFHMWWKKFTSVRISQYNTQPEPKNAALGRLAGNRTRNFANVVESPAKRPTKGRCRKIGYEFWIRNSGNAVEVMGIFNELHFS